MHRMLSHATSLSFAAVLLVAAASAADAQKKYDPGATDTEIKIGNIMPYSGPASAYATIGKTEAAYFNKLNTEGGINGRKVNFISYDDGYSPPKTVEQARKLVESDEVLLIFNPLGTPGNTAIQKYMNTKKVPQIFVSTGAAKWNDPKNFPWTMGWQPNYQTEARIYAAYILKNHPGKTIGVLYQNDDFGKDYIIGLREGLGDQASKLIVIESSYETASPTVDSQVVQIKGANPDIFINIATPKFAAQAIKKVAELNWHPIHFLTNVSVSIGGVMKPAGYENDQGILSTNYLKDPKDPQWKNDPGHERMAGVHDQMVSGRRPGRRVHRVCLRRCKRDRAGAAAVQGRSHPRERHEAGGQSEFRDRHLPAGHQDQDGPDRLRPARAAADDALQGRDLGSVRPGHERREEHLTVELKANRTTVSELVMPGLVPGIHVFDSRPQQNVDGRASPAMMERLPIQPWRHHADHRRPGASHPHSL